MSAPYMDSVTPLAALSQIAEDLTADSMRQPSHAFAAFAQQQQQLLTSGSGGEMTRQVLPPHKTWEQIKARLPFRLERSNMFFTARRTPGHVEDLWSRLLGGSANANANQNTDATNSILPISGFPECRRYVVLSFIPRPASKRKIERLFQNDNKEGLVSFTLPVFQPSLATLSMTIQARRTTGMGSSFLGAPSSTSTPQQPQQPQPPITTTRDPLLLAGQSTCHWNIPERHIKLHQHDSLGRQEPHHPSALPGHQLRALVLRIEHDLKMDPSLPVPELIWTAGVKGQVITGPIAMKPLEEFAGIAGVDVGVLKVLLRDAVRPTEGVSGGHQVFVGKWEDRWRDWGSGWEDFGISSGGGGGSL
ncbi:hypothetical protein HDU76_006238 [Blyttiomyces sp. JEL0837]|nr:hypothetical protein HDU76_006238 [Blyttiomyces sp. JEL0837]